MRFKSGDASRMLDIMTAEHRQKIVSAMLAKGMSTVAIATRIGVPVATVRTDRLVLSAPNPEEVRKFSLESLSAHKPATGQSEMHPEDRREAVARLHLKGVTDAEISRVLNIPTTTVGRDRMQMNLVLQSPEIAINARRAKVKEMIDSGANRKEIAKAVGVTGSTVSRDREALGYGPWIDAEAQEIENRRKSVKELIDSGLTCKEIGVKLGVTSMTVIRDCEVLGITPKRSIAGIAMAQAERRAAVRAEYEQGKTITEIADKLGIHRGTVHGDIKYSGLSRHAE